MNRILIVDDDAIVRIGIRTMLEMHKETFQIVGEAENGKEAYQKIQQSKPDLVLCDVKMPVMDGITLVETIRHTDPDLCLIMMSYYSDIDLVKQALFAGANDYILKTACNAQTLSEVIQKQRVCKRHLVTEMPDSEENLLLKVLNQEAHSCQDPRISEKQFAVACGELDNYAQITENYSLDAKTKLQLSVRNILHQVCKTLPAHHILHRKENEFLLLLQIPEREDFLHYLSMGQASLRQFTNYTMSFCYAPTTVPVGQLSNTYGRISAELTQRFYRQREAITAYGDPVSPTKLTSQQYAEFAGRLKLCCEQSVGWEKELDLIKLACIQQKYAPEDIKNLIYHCMKDAYATAQLEGTSVTALTQEFHSIDEAFQTLTNVYRQLKQTKSAYEHPVIRKAKQYIADHLSCPGLSLAEVSAHLGISAVYLSSLFKKQKSITITDYIIEKRMQLAYTLLMGDKKKIYEVAKMVGFQNPSYFMRCFKKTFGISPSECRQQEFLP